MLTNAHRDPPRRASPPPRITIRTTETYEIESEGEPGYYYQVKYHYFARTWSCTCWGAVRHGHCKHIRQARWRMRALMLKFRYDISGKWEVLAWKKP